MPGEPPRLGDTKVGATHENRDTVGNDAEMRQTR